MAIIKFLIETIDHDFARISHIQEYFQLQYELIEKGHVLEYYTINSSKVATSIETKDHFYNFIRSFKFLNGNQIIEKLHSVS